MTPSALPRSLDWHRRHARRRVASPPARASRPAGVRPALRWVTPLLAGVLGAALGVLALGHGSAGAATPVAAPAAAAGGLAPGRSPLAATGADWRSAADDADVQRAFDDARASGRPVLLYWGASWCPPCNRLKSSLFNRAEFVALSRGFVAVHVDGDLPGAQKLGARFRVRGYPTLVLLSPSGHEITRLPGEGEPAQVLRALRIGLAGGRPVATVLADARAGRALGASEWRLLAFFSWETAADGGDGVVVSATDRPEVLAELAVAASRAAAASGTAARPDAETVTRLWLKALAASDEARGVTVDAGLRQRVDQVLADPARSRRHADILAGAGDDLVRALAPAAGTARAAWAGRMDAALRRLQSDASLARADRLAALGTRVELARLDQPKDAVQVTVTAGLRRELAETVARDDRTITDGHERQAVITLAAHVLARAGDWAGSDVLLQANLARSHSAYYLMSQLGSNARRQGRPDEALQWFERAYADSRGPATRLQWGSSYLNALIELAPQDAARIERAAAGLLQDAAGDAGAFHERSGRAMDRIGRLLGRWSAEGRHAEAMARLRSQLEPVCRAQPAGSAERGRCEGLLRPAGAA
jgi:thiol-disulfide isomerase/thioredoxin